MEPVCQVYKMFEVVYLTPNPTTEARVPSKLRVGEMLEATRLQKLWTLEALSAKSGISTQRLRAYEACTEDPDVCTLHALRQILDF